MTPINPRLERLLGGQDTLRLRERLCQKLRRGQMLIGGVTLDRPSTAEYAAIARLLGRSTGQLPAKLSIDLKQLDHALVTAGLCIDLADAVKQIEGPIQNEQAEKDRASIAWDTMLQEANLAGQHITGYPSWLEDLQATGLLRRLAGSDPEQAKHLLTSSQRILEALPHRGITRQVLAAQQLGDSHALDPGKPVATLLLRAIGLKQSKEEDQDAQLEHHTRPADERHALWESVGVFENDLTRSVLTLNLRVEDNGLVAQTLRLHTDHGQPCALTLRHLIQHTPTLTNHTHRD